MTAGPTRRAPTPALDPRDDGVLAPPAPLHRRDNAAGAAPRRGDTTVAQRIGWSACARGGPVTLFRVVGGEHEPPAKSRGQDIDAAEEVWRFFRRLADGEVTPAVRLPE